MSLTLEQYRQLVKKEKCFCGTRLPQRIAHYDHEGGWYVEGFAKPQWLYIVCTNPRCNSEIALWKAGVDRTVGDDEYMMSEGYEKFLGRIEIQRRTAMTLRAEAEAGRALKEMTDIMGISSEAAVEIINMPEGEFDALCNARIKEITETSGTR
jgi:hypothetical protein